jgi:DNA-binding NarL/FixJ family response regulator
MSIRVLVAYNQSMISEDLSSLFKKDHDMQLVGIVNSHQLNDRVVEQLNPHLVVVGHIANPHDLWTGPEFDMAVHGQQYQLAGMQTKPDLGDREEQVLKLVAVGRTSKEIARNLAISPSTVDVHRRNIMRKLGLHKAADLTRFAIRHQIISV